MKIKTTTQKIPVSLMDKVDRIRVKKLKLGQTKLLLSRRRILSAIDNLPNLEEILIRASIKDDRK